MLSAHSIKSNFKFIQGANIMYNQNQSCSKWKAWIQNYIFYIFIRVPMYSSYIHYNSGYILLRSVSRAASQRLGISWGSPAEYSMIDCSSGDAFGVLSCQFWNTVLQCGVRLPIHTLNYWTAKPVHGACFLVGGVLNAVNNFSLLYILKKNDINKTCR